MTAMLRVNTLWHYIFSRPARWLAGKSRQLNCWSIDSSSKVLDPIEKAMVEVAVDGRVLLDPAFDPFASIADEQPLFERFRARWAREFSSLSTLRQRFVSPYQTLPHTKVSGRSTTARADQWVHLSTLYLWDRNGLVAGRLCCELFLTPRVVQSCVGCSPVVPWVAPHPVSTQWGVGCRPPTWSLCDCTAFCPPPSLGEIVQIGGYVPGLLLA